MLCFCGHTSNPGCCSFQLYINVFCFIFGCQKADNFFFALPREDWDERLLCRFIFLLSYNVLLPRLGRCPFRGFLKFFSGFSSVSVEELSVVDLTSFSSGWSDYSSASESASAYGSAAASSLGSSASVASSLLSAGESVVKVPKLNCCSKEPRKLL